MNHWPRTHEFQPQSEEHLRKWLQCRAGYRNADTIDTSGMTPEQAVAVTASRMDKAGPFAFVRASGPRLYIITSQSINFDDLPHLKACALFDAVAEVIEAETGVRCDDMLKHTPRKSRTFQVEASA